VIHQSREKRSCLTGFFIVPTMIALIAIAVYQAGDVRYNVARGWDVYTLVCRLNPVRYRGLSRFSRTFPFLIGIW